MALSKKLLPILLHLDADPLISYQELAEKVGISWPTAKKRYNEAIKRNILYNPIASYEYKKLGLINATAIVFVPNYAALMKLEMASHAHPHTVYRCRLVGQEFGIFIKFFIPDNPEAFDYLGQFMRYLENKGWISEYTLMRGSSDFEDTINLYSNLDYYDFDDGIWKFNWLDWFQGFDDFSDFPSTISTIPVDKLDPEEFTRTRFIILNRLTKNAAIKQADLMRDNELGLSRTEAHRHYNYVMNNLVYDVVNMYDRSRFNLSDLNLFVIKDAEPEFLTKFYHYLDTNPPPFRISVEILDDNTLVIWSMMSQNLAQTFGYELWKLSSQMKMYNMVYSGSSSARYPFYVDNFDFFQKEWKSSEKWMLTDPIAILEKDLEK